MNQSKKQRKGLDTVKSQPNQPRKVYQRRTTASTAKSHAEILENGDDQTTKESSKSKQPRKVYQRRTTVSTAKSHAEIPENDDDHETAIQMSKSKQPRKVSQRRTTASATKSYAEINENDDDDETAKKMSNDQEDILISEILKHYSVIEDKSTDQSLTSANFASRQNDAWIAVQKEVFAKTKVSDQFQCIFVFDLLLDCAWFCNC